MTANIIAIDMVCKSCGSPCKGYTSAAWYTEAELRARGVRCVACILYGRRRIFRMLDFLCDVWTRVSFLSFQGVVSRIRDLLKRRDNELEKIAEEWLLQADSQYTGEAVPLAVQLRFEAWLKEDPRHAAALERVNAFHAVLDRKIQQMSPEFKQRLLAEIEHRRPQSDIS